MVYLSAANNVPSLCSIQSGHVNVVFSMYKRSAHLLLFLCCAVEALSLVLWAIVPCSVCRQLNTLLYLTTTASFQGLLMLTWLVGSVSTGVGFVSGPLCGDLCVLILHTMLLSAAYTMYTISCMLYACCAINQTS